MMKTMKTLKAVLLMSFMVGFTVQVKAQEGATEWTPDLDKVYVIKSTEETPRFLTYAGTNAKAYFNATVNILNQAWRFIAVDGDNNDETTEYYIVSLKIDTNVTPFESLSEEGISRTNNSGPWQSIRVFVDNSGHYAIKLVGWEAASSASDKNRSTLFINSNGNLNFQQKNATLNVEPSIQDYMFIIEEIGADIVDTEVNAELASLVETATPIAAYDCEDESLKEALFSALEAVESIDENATPSEKINLAQSLLRATEAVKADRAFKIHAGETSLTIPVTDWGITNQGGLTNNTHQSTPHYAGTSSTAILHIGKIDFSKMGSALKSIVLSIGNGGNNTSSFGLYIDDKALVATSNPDNFIAEIPNPNNGKWDILPSYVMDLAKAQTITGFHDVYLKHGYTSGKSTQANITEITFTVYKTVEWTGNSETPPTADDIVILPETANISLSNNITVKKILWQEGAQINSGTYTLTAEEIRIDYTIAEKHTWYSIGFPFEIASIYGNKWETDLTPATHFLLYEYKKANENGEEEFIPATTLAANKGYIIQFPNGYEGEKITFVSGPVEHTNSAIEVTANSYQLLANPTLGNYSLTPQADKNYYIYNKDANAYQPLSDEATLKPFEAAITVGGGTFRSSIGVGPSGTTGIDGTTPETTDPVIATRYYTLPGIEVKQPSESGIYIVKKIHASQRENISKIIYIKK
jgi:hypothetical protein